MVKIVNKESLNNYADRGAAASSFYANDYCCYSGVFSNAELREKILKNKRHITKQEIEILERNLNKNEDSTWSEFYVDKDSFHAELIQLSYFSGFIVLGKMENVTLNYNDLHLQCGIMRSRLNNVVTGDFCCIGNVSYLDNYMFGDRVILFNIQEMCCTNHSKFGNGILKNGEPEENRIWIGVANENDGRRVLPFENMIPGDAYLWSHYRGDKELLNRFFELTNYGNDGKLNTSGYIDNDSVIKNCGVIKDVKIGKAAYIKGAFKLKNITICSSEEEPTQVGEGVELVNGILGYGSRVFYQAIGVRFIIGRNCQVKYGARVLNSVLGDNSTVSCCEILNNLIYPFHEQHHNSSFLIATTVMGQSNIASGATIGSNHNSRSPDGEIIANRGFWPGLCSDFKHNSKFASFDLIAKGSYQYELYIPYPFALVAPGINGNQSISITPAWLFMYDMFAITRNKYKFLKRDKRVVKVQNVEVDPLAPDTMEEVLGSIERLNNLIREYLKEIKYEKIININNIEEENKIVKDFIKNNKNADFTLKDNICQKKYGATIFKPVKAYIMYRQIAEYFAVRSIVVYCNCKNINQLTSEIFMEMKHLPLYTKWENVGGQIIPSQKVQELFTLIKNHEIENWDSVHNFYNSCQNDYEKYKVRYSIYILEQLYSDKIENFTTDIYRKIKVHVKIVCRNFYTESYSSREKDYTDFYRNMMYSSEIEKEAVLGSINHNSFLKKLKEETDLFIKKMDEIFISLTK